MVIIPLHLLMITEANITFIGQEKGKVIIHGTGKYIFDVYGENLISKFENLDFVDVIQLAGNYACFKIIWIKINFTVNNCNFRNISAKYGAIDLEGDKGIIILLTVLLKM